MEYHHSQGQHCAYGGNQDFQKLSQNVTAANLSSEGIDLSNAVISQFGSYTSSNSHLLSTNNMNISSSELAQSNTLMYLQPSNNNSFSNLSTSGVDFSSATQEHLSPDSYVLDFASPQPYDINSEKAYPDTQILSPLPASDDGQSGYLSTSFPASSFSNHKLSHNTNAGYFGNTSIICPNLPSLSPQGSELLNDPSSYSGHQRQHLSLNVPVFGNDLYGISSNHSSAHASTVDFSELYPQSYLTSPVVRIQNYDDVPSHADLSGKLDSKTHDGNLLKPNNFDDLVDEQRWSAQSVGHQSSHTISRNENGAWTPVTERGTRGLSPIERAVLSSQEVPTLDEQEKLRERSAKNAIVADWLTVTAVNAVRPRAKSDVTGMQKDRPDYGLLLPISQPGPGVLVNETSDYGEEEEGLSIHSDDDSNPESLSASAMPFIDPDSNKHTVEVKSKTANAAIMAFAIRNKQKDMDEASIAATIDTQTSRRRSMSDLGSLWSQEGISRQVTIQKARARKGISGFIQGIVPNRIPSRDNIVKRKFNNDSTATLVNQSQKDNSSQSLAPSNQRRMSSLLSRPKTPQLNTDLPVNRSGARSPMNRLSKLRSRSKSDSGQDPYSNLAQMWRQHGGPPVAYHAAPSKNDPGSQEAIPAKASGNESDDEEDGVDMDLSVRLDMTVFPTRKGFEKQIKALNPHIDPVILERQVREQCNRYHRLVEMRAEHQNRALTGKCSSQHLCAQLGGRGEPILAKQGARSSLPIFQIVPAGLRPGTNSSDAQQATFRKGVPLPPVSTLPSKFECSYCFVVREFKKPSDWTKHIHEDVQPFTCTFPWCTDVKSFKRKADWVRHESERHRQLESWTCNFKDCAHVCYRRDNFVQHLVREHKIPEPKIRTGRTGGTRTVAWTPNTPVDFGDDNGPQFFRNDDQINSYTSQHVDKCHSDRSKDECTEACRFCGNLLKSWKQLTVHLAKHMEQIAMPILPLIEQHPMTRPASYSFAQIQVQQSPAGVMLNHPTIPVDNQSGDFLYDEPGEMENTPTIAISGPNVQYTYPPANITSSMFEVDTYGANLNGSSFPPPAMNSRSRGSSFGEGSHYSFQRPDNTFPPANLMMGGYNGVVHQSIMSLGMAPQVHHGQHAELQQNQYDQHSQQFLS